MREILYRLGQVAWWLGAIWLVIAPCSFIFVLLDGGNIQKASVGLFICLLALPFWAVSYVLAGSFWRAPRPQ